jgi:hypothetical protein
VFWGKGDAGLEKIKATPLTFLLFLAAFFFIGFLINLLGYRFVSVFDFMPYIYSVTIIIFLMIKVVINKAERTKLMALCAVILPILAFFYAISLWSANFWAAIIHLLVILICSICIFFLYVSNIILKACFGAIYVLFVAAIVGILVIFWPFMLIGKDTIIKSELSPNGIYLLEITDNDQGALGGNTYVQASRRDQDIPLLIGVLQKKPVNMYRGRWGEGFSMDVRWETDNILYLDGKRYDLP